jgi:uncharacterized membrane protein YukC
VRGCLGLGAETRKRFFAETWFFFGIGMIFVIYQVISRSIFLMFLRLHRGNLCVAATRFWVGYQYLALSTGLSPELGDLRP